MIDCQQRHHDVGDDDDVASLREWAEGIRLETYTVGQSSDQNKFGAWPQTVTVQSFNFQGDSAQEESFQLFPKPVGNSEDMLSPKLWSAKNSPIQHQLQPSCQAVEILRYQLEMMELVKDARESSYELSLKDIVDMPKAGKAQKARVRRKISRSESREIGVFTFNLFLPFSLGGNRGKGSVRSPAGNSKVSPKPVKVSVQSTKVREFGKQNEYSDVSRSFDSNRRRSESRKLTGCYLCLAKKILSESK